MSIDKLQRQSEFGSPSTPPSLGTPGKLPATARLPGRPMILRVSDANGVEPDADAAVDRAAGSSGSALPDDLRGRFESSLGADLSSVRVHTGAESAEAAKAVGAKAYTTGQDIHFGAGYYDPTSAFGTHLLAHEVAHTVQQQGSVPSRQYKLEVSAPQDAAEVEADRAADAMVGGSAFSVGSHGGGWLGRMGEDKTVKHTATITTRGLKLNQEGSMKLGTIGAGQWAKLEVTGMLIGEEALEWSKTNKEIGISVAGSSNNTKNEAGVDAKEQFNWTPYQDKAREKAYAALGEKWEDGFQVTEEKLTVDFPAFKFRPEAIQVGGACMISVSFANKVKIAGGFEVVIKGGKDVKGTDQGLQLVGTGEMPIFGGETSLGDDVTIKGKLSAKLEAKLKPNWETIARKVLEQFAEKTAETAAQGTATGSGAAAGTGNGAATASQGAATTSQGAATTSQGAATATEGAATATEGAATATEGAATVAEGAAETAATGAEAAGGATVAEAAIAVGGGLLIVASMGYALASGAQDLADADGVVLGANQARDSWAAGYCSGLGAVRAAPDMAAYGQGMTAGRAKLDAVLGQMRGRLGSTTATDEELKAGLMEQVNQQLGTIFENARKSVANDIGMKFVQAFWSQHAGSWYGRIGLSQTTRNIAGRLNVVWSPPSEDASDAPPAAPAPAPSQPLENPGDAPGTCDEETSSCSE